MSYAILPVTTADLPDLVTIHDAAFQLDRIVGNLMPGVPREVKRAYDLAWYRREFEMSKLNGLVVYKAVDECGKMVGFVKWQYPYTLTSEQEAEKQTLDNVKEQVLPLPRGTNIDLYKQFLEPLDEKRRRYVEKGTMYFLHILAVDPSLQRKGIGSLLVRRGLEDVDKDSAKTYIEASPAGLQLYIKHGWKEIDKVLVDVGKIDGKGLATEVCLVREAKSG